MTTRLKVFMAEHGIKQNWLADKARINPTTLNMIVNGKAIPNLKTAQRIAYALGTTVDYLWPYKPGEDEQ